MVPVKQAAAELLACSQAMSPSKCEARTIDGDLAVASSAATLRAAP